MRARRPRRGRPGPKTVVAPSNRRGFPRQLLGADRCELPVAPPGGGPPAPRASGLRPPWPEGRGAGGPAGAGSPAPCPRARCRVPAVPTLSLRDPRASVPSCRRGPLPAAAARRPRRQNGDPDPDSDPAARGRRCRLPNPPGCRWRPSHRTHPRRSFPASWSGPPWASCPVFEPLRAAWRGTPCASLARGVKDFSAVPRVVPEPFPFSPGSPLGCTASCTVHPQETGGSVSTRRRGCAGRRAGRRGGPS